MYTSSRCIEDSKSDLVEQSWLFHLYAFLQQIIPKGRIHRKYRLEQPTIYKLSPGDACLYSSQHSDYGCPHGEPGTLSPIDIPNIGDYCQTCHGNHSNLSRVMRAFVSAFADLERGMGNLDIGDAVHRVHGAYHREMGMEQRRPQQIEDTELARTGRRRNLHSLRQERRENTGEQCNQALPDIVGDVGRGIHDDHIIGASNLLALTRTGVPMSDGETQTDNYKFLQWIGDCVATLEPSSLDTLGKQVRNTVLLKVNHSRQRREYPYTYQNTEANLHSISSSDTLRQSTTNSDASLFTACEYILSKTVTSDCRDEVEVLKRNNTVDIPSLLQPQSPRHDVLTYKNDYLVNPLNNVHLRAISPTCVTPVYDVNGAPYVIGQGSFGTVKLAVYVDDTGQRREVAAKYFHDGTVEDIMKEAKVQAYLQPTGYVPEVFGILHVDFETGKQLVMVQEMIGEGKTLVEYMSAPTGAITYECWVRICQEMTTGLENIHAMNTLVNDLKEDNIIVDLAQTDRPLIRFIDMGHATVAQPLVFQYDSSYLETFVHIAPEVRRNQPSSIKSDVYSLGRIFMFIGSCQKIRHIYDLGCDCMKPAPDDRPSVEFIKNQLKAIHVMYPTDFNNTDVDSTLNEAIGK